MTASLVYVFGRLCSVLVYEFSFFPCSGWALSCVFFFFFQAEDGIRDLIVTGVQTCALPISGLIAAGLSLINFVSASVILRESLAAEHRRERPLFDLGHMSEALRRERLRPLMLVWFLAPFFFAGYTLALPLHATQAFSLGAKELGWLFLVIGVIAAAGPGVL